MGAGNYSKLVTVLTGQTITASERNNEHDNHINNSDFAGLDDYSPDITTMRVTTDPYPASAESLPTSGAGELERLRYLIKQITGQAQWYIDPTKDLTQLLALTGGTMSGNIAMGSNKLTGLAAGSSNGDSVRYEQLNPGKILQIQAGSSSTTKTTTSSTYQTSNLTVAITPTASTSKVFVLAWGDLQTGSTTTIVEVALFRDSTNISVNSIGAALLCISAGSQSVPASLGAVDAPATTSAITYSVKVKSSDNASSVSWGATAGQYILAIEIGQ